MLQPAFCLRAGRIAVLALLCASTAALTARGADIFDPMSQVGPNPVLPPPQQYLLPPMRLARVVGWKQGETPTVAPGLKIEPLAEGLEHPRSVYVLPNGDVLVVESKSPNVQPIRRPKDIVVGWIESWVTSGGRTGESNRIILLRDANGDGKPQIRSIFLELGLAVRRGAGRLRFLRRQYRRRRALSLQ
jgi:glucose/arabinose dehydrogenase